MYSCLVESVVCSAQDALIAQECGADRIELCSAIECGGITPSLGLVQQVLAAVSIPVMAMIRPRSGDFRYREDEFQTMELDIQAFRDAGLGGIVFAALDENRQIDKDACRRLLKVAGTMQTVFHRAFDQIASCQSAVETLVGLGFTRVLTSGQAETALEGANVLRELVIHGGIEVLAGGSIRPDNISALLKASGVNQIHLGPMKHVGQHPGLYGDGYRILNGEVLRSAVKEAKGFAG